MWMAGDIRSLLQEGHSIQTRLTMAHVKEQVDHARAFARLMFAGKVKAALLLISKDEKGGLLTPDQPVGDGTDKVIDILKKKHPPQQPLVQSVLTTESSNVFHPVIFEETNGSLIRSVALRVQGTAEPSGLDAACWRRMCMAFHGESNQLCEAMAKLAVRINTTYVDPEGLTLFVACRLIAPDKCSGVRPIGVGEVLHWIICKATLNLVREDVQNAVGPLQLCVRHDSGWEAAVHAMRTIYKEEESEAVLLVDASNAFNSLNRSNALHNIMSICPSLATIVINSYRQHPQLFIDKEKLLSQEGTTQGDPLAMAIYAISVQPLVQCLNQKEAKQVWFAEDSAAGEKLCGLLQWWEKLSTEGPKFGYHPNPSKTWVVVKECHYAEALDKFASTGYQISKDGREYLG